MKLTLQKSEILPQIPRTQEDATRFYQEIVDRVKDIYQKTRTDLETVQSMKNIIKNGDFLVWASGLPTAWTKEGSATVTGDTAFAATVEATATDEGIKQTISRLKASTRYKVSVDAIVTAGDTGHIVTTGGDKNIDIEFTTSGNKSELFETDSSATDVVLKLMAKANGDIITYDNVECYEYY